MEIKETEKVFWFEAYSTKDWCGCCERPRAQVKVTVTLEYGQIRVELEDKNGEPVYAEEYCCWRND